jgi:IS5 family transposase
MRFWNSLVIEIDPLIDWEVFRPIIRKMYDNHTEQGGRPNNV